MINLKSIELLIYSNLMIIIITGLSYIMDFVSGITKAVINKNIQSSKLKKSMRKGIIYGLYILMGVCMQILFPVNIKIFGQNVDIFIYGSNIYIISTEFLSIIENNKDIKSNPIIEKFLKEIKEKISNIDIKIS